MSIESLAGVLGPRQLWQLNGIATATIHCRLVAACLVAAVVVLLVMIAVILYQECLQQTAARILSLAALRQILWALLPLVMLIALAVPVVVLFQHYCCC